MIIYFFTDIPIEQSEFSIYCYRQSLTTLFDQFPDVIKQELYWSFNFFSHRQSY